MTGKLLLAAGFIAGLAAFEASHAAEWPFGKETLRPFPSLNLAARQSKGQDAIDRLGIHLPDVAAWYGKTPDQLRKELLQDRRMRLDQTGRILYVEELEAPVGTLQGEPTTAQEGLAQGALVGLDQTFYLHSHPGATRTIYLDFNGATITGTAWNSNGNTIYAPAFDIDGNPGSFSDAELQRIQYIWQRVAEDYAPFDVDVTTEQPSPDVLTRSGVNDQVFGTTVVITKTDGVYNCNCGGIAYVGVFNYSGGTKPPDYYKPAFVFYNKLGGGNEKVVAEAISHEAGHNMGLHHDGTASDSYYEGQGSDPVTGWAPIMGVGYYKPLVQFSRGEYAGANNKEDDFVVAQNFGLPMRLDDYGNSIIAAAPLQTAPGGVTSSIDGIIGAADDRDVFSVAVGAGPLTATVSPAFRSANADLVLTLMDGAGRVVASANPANMLGATLSFTIPAQGTYYLEVRGTGQGDALDTGYSAYGAIGNFRVTVSHVAPSGAVPVAVLSADVTSGTGPLAVTFDGTRSVDDSGVAFWYWDFGDGTVDQSGSLAAVTHVYEAPGIYVARLMVVDDSGLSAVATTSINVSAPLAQPTVQLIDLKLKTGRRGVSATAMITVLSAEGQPIRGAKVQANWGGAVNRIVSRKSAATGKAVFASPVSKEGGCFTIAVTSIAAAGHSFDAAALPSAQICG